jgi:hypothetical protein
MRLTSKYLGQIALRCLHFCNWRVYLERARITDDGVAKLSGSSQLEFLNLCGTDVSDEGVRTLKNTRSLQRLCVVDTKVSDVAIKELEGVLPKLTVIRTFSD